MTQFEKDIREIRHLLEKDMMLSVFFGKSERLFISRKICKEAEELVIKSGHKVRYADGETYIE